ncbi:hypothetical protein FBUS_00408 [Fasciolopsis buskii]|uniref:TRPM SLOG domain-containing protein n=1 Tax=Fasciolopsis buskii TaxID=27845 RepID=A0A8E0RT88_9TREM|nr:hypothetical protein FBUS_00408 [Fasciolopsis buski]
MDLAKTPIISSGKKKKKTRKPQLSTDRLTTPSCFDLSGEVHFTGVEEPLKFTRVTGRPSRVQWQQLLADRWNLKPPTLIISIIGSRAELSKRFKLTLKNGLWKAAESAGFTITDQTLRFLSPSGCCIISDGLDRGMTKIAGEAVRDYTEAYGGDHMVMVGVASSEHVAFRELFKASNASQAKGKEPKTTVYYPDPLSDEEPDDGALSSTSSMDLPYWTERFSGGNQAKPMDRRTQSGPAIRSSGSQKDRNRNETKHKFRLNANHQYLLLVNNEPGDLNDSQSNRYLETRILFERTIVTWAKVETKLPRASIALPNLTNGLFDGADTLTSRIFAKKLSSRSEEQNRNLVPSKSGEHDRSVGRSQLSAANGTTADDSKHPDDVHPSRASVTETQTTPSEVIAKVPICGIVAGSGASLIEHVYSSVTLNRCPMVIVRGTGGMADVIANVIDFMAFKDSFEENVITDEEIDMKIASIIHETRTEIQGQPQGGRARNKKFQPRSKDDGLTDKPSGPNSGARNTEAQQSTKPPTVDFKAYAHQVQLLRDLTENYGHLLSVFDTGLDTPRNELNLDQLEIAIRLNRADIARTKIFLEGKRWKDYKSGLFQQLWKHARIYKMDWVMLRDIGRMIKNLIGDFYQPLYLSKKFRNTVVERGAHDSSDEDEIDQESPEPRGWSIHSFFPVHPHQDYKSGLFQQLWKHARIYKMDWVMLRDIGRMIKNLIGDFYQPLYLSKKFRNTVVERGAHDSSDEDEIDQESPEPRVRTGTTGLPRAEEASSATTSASSIPEEGAAEEEETTFNSYAVRSRGQNLKRTESARTEPAASTKRPREENQTTDKRKSDLSISGLVKGNNVTDARKYDAHTSSSETAANGDVRSVLTKQGSNRRYIRSQLDKQNDEDDEDRVTLKGISDSASGADSDTTLIQHRPRRQHHRRAVSTGRTSRQLNRVTVMESRPRSTGPYSAGRRRCIVRPITGLNLGYQPYLGFTNPVYNGESLLSGKTGRTPPMGRRRQVTITQDGRTVIMAPRAQAESTRNLSIVSSNKTNGTVSGVTSAKSETMIPVDQVLHDPSNVIPNHICVLVFPPIPTLLVPDDHARESQVRHAVFADDLNQPLFQRARSPVLFGLRRASRSEPRPPTGLSARRKSSSGARRVAHSILHPLTDPEKAQLQIREIERMARERRREKERRHRHRVAQGKFTLMERLTGKAKEQRLEELKPAKLANFSHTSAVMFERPAREIMVLCILVGKLTMAEVFWSHEKEPIASALVASILFSELASKADDMASKEEYEEAARYVFLFE